MLRFTSIIALISVIYLVFIVVFYAFDYKAIPGNTKFPSSTITPQLWGAVINFDLFNTLPVFVFGFTCHQNVRTDTPSPLLSYLGLRDPGYRRP